MLTDLGSPVRPRRDGVRRHVRERAGRPAHRLPVPAGQPARRHRAGHRRPVRAGAGLVDLRGRRPDVALQRQRRGAQDADPAPDPLGHLVGQFERRSDEMLQSCSTPRSPRSWCRPARARRSRAARPRSARTRCRISRCSTCCATGSGRRRSRSWPGTRGATPRRATGRRASRTATGLLTQGDSALAAGLRAALLLVQPVQALRAAQWAEGVAGGSLSPRGDWRAPSDMSARTWLDEIERDVPED